MRLIEVTREDMAQVAQLIKVLQSAKFSDVAAADMAAVLNTLRWAGELGKQLSESFKAGEAVGGKVTLDPPAPLLPAPAAKKSGRLSPKAKG